VTVSVSVASHPHVLVASLCDRLATPPEDPFVTELIAVPSRGIERWLTQRIATGLAARGVGDGICANVDFPTPGRLVREALLAVPDVAPSVEAWEGSVLLGHVLDTIDRHIDEPWMRLVQRYFDSEDGSIGANRYVAAAKIARLFAGYGRRRPEMIRAWATGADSGPGDAAVPAPDRWQPQLWRFVREQIGLPAVAELLPGGLEPIRAGAVDLDLPGRISIYGLTATDPLDLEVLVALGEGRDVDLYVLHPSPAMWTSAAPHTAPGRTSRTADSTAAIPEHPILASWGRDSRELQSVLAAHSLGAEPMVPGLSRPVTLLQHLQHGIRANQPLFQDPDLARHIDDGTDRSVQIHVTHGARRQVEVVRDAILHVLAADPTLEPRDVVIMTPDLATFAPLLETAFPADRDEDAAGGDLPDLRLRIADRSPAAVNPLVRFAATVLDIVDSRLEASVVRELVTRPVVQQRFGFDHEAAAEIVRVIDDGHISWGLDAADRATWHAGATGERTWSRGMDRALTGVFYSDSPTRVVGGTTVPLHGIEGQEATPVGLLAAMVDRLRAARDLLAGPLPVSRWARVIGDAVHLLAAPAWGDEWQLGQLERLLAETFPTDRGPDPTLGLAEARSAVASWTQSRPSPLHFRTGDVTVCTLVPMRSVPYRVVCLLGMDDERFPRSSRTDGDDLLRDDERVGDFDRSSEDRQLLLDAVMAAGDHLIITFSGRDQLTNAELPPAVPVAELQDAVADLAGPQSLERIATVHPLQSFSAVNFTPGGLNRPGPFGFDSRQLAGAIATTQPGPRPADLAGGWPEWEPPEPIALDDLSAFLDHPVRRFMQTRMGFAVPERGELPDDTIPADLGGLGAWALKERILTGLADGHDIGALVAGERAADRLPPGRLGEDDLAGAVDAATSLWSAAIARGYDREAMRPFRGSVSLEERSIEGTVHADPDHAHLFTITASKVRAKQRLRAYVRLVFLTALVPDIAWKAVVLGRRDSGRGHVAVTLRSLGRAADERRRAAVERLTALTDLYIEGHRGPLPLPCESAYAWQRYAKTDRPRAWGSTRDVWETDRFNPESLDPAHRLLLPGLDSMNELVRSGFVKYCERLWSPILPLIGEKSI
jgi:exodeoxyribonuclease V gamma subunit